MKIILSSIFAIILTLNFNLSAQQISKTNLIPKVYTGDLSSNENPVLQKVHQSFKNGKESMVIDFTQATVKESKSQAETLKPFLNYQEMFSISNKTGFENIIKQKPSIISVLFSFKNKLMTLDLVENNITTEDFKFYTDKDPAGTSKDGSVFYQGVVRNTNSLVSLSFFEGHVEGFISIQNKKAIEITQLRDNTGKHIIFSNDDFLVKAKGRSCTILYPPKSGMVEQKVNADAAVKNKCITNFWETDYAVYQYFQSTKKIKDFALCLFNTYATMYARENITMKLKGGFIWTSADPYVDPHNNSYKTLENFSNLRTNFNADLAMLLSNKPTGGIAWIKSICETDDYSRHSLCGSILTTEEIFPVTDYSWASYVTTHEVGHNLGSQHTHDCAWNGNHTAIDGCGYDAGYLGCPGPIPSDGGTVMSYCHLLSVGVDLEKGFGPQPGNLIRRTINSCIGRECKPISLDCAPPKNVKAKNVTSNSALISWTRVVNASYYYLYISNDNGLTWTLVANNLYASTYQLTGLSSNQNYLCDVWVACANGGFESTSVSFTTTSSADNNNIIAFKIYPNPVINNHFTVSLAKGYENAMVEIINNNNLIIEVNKNNSSVRSFTKPKLKGLYIVRVTKENEVFTQKLLVQ